MDIKLTALEQVKQCLTNKQNFVLQGGAGSGKTETLKELLTFISKNNADSSLVCITHTNKAANEINKRIGGVFPTLTIHSFLHSLISGFKLDIHRIIIDIFAVAPFTVGANEDYESESDFLKAEFERFKKTYETYSRRIYELTNSKTPKHVGKREYDKDRSKYNLELNQNIDNLNQNLRAYIFRKDPYSIKYNQRKYDSLRSLSYGHDSLITIACILLRKSTVLRKIVSDRFNYIFIDEYQDTSPEIIEALISLLAKERNILVGLFGDSMQGIYDGGIGDVDRYVSEGMLTRIEKEDNFRCSKQVVDFLNPLRLDKMTQEVAFKTKDDGSLETLDDRQGYVRGYYSIYENKPSTKSERADKEQYSTALNKLVERAGGTSNQKILMLTNKAIAVDAGFSHLFEIFSDRYGTDLTEQIEKTLGILQFDEIVELCSLFQNNRYNEVISILRRNGFTLSKSTDKLDLFNRMNEIISSKSPAIEVLEASINYGLIAKNESHANYVEHAHQFLATMSQDPQFLLFCEDFSSGLNTVKRMTDAGRDIDEYLFDELKNQKSKYEFLSKLLGNAISFDNIKNYFDYIDEKKSYITMHKTKGTGIENVLVVLDEYFWNEYNFENIFSTSHLLDSKTEKNRKLVYVACSRAKRNLSCVRLISAAEEDAWKAAFPEVIKVPLEELC